MRPAGVRISGRAHGRRGPGDAEGQAHGNVRSTPAIRPVDQDAGQWPGEGRLGQVVVMCGRRYRGRALRGGNLTRLAAVLLVAVALAGTRAIQDLLNGILITLSVLTAGVLAIFVLQVRISRKRAVRPVPAAVVAAPRPVPAAVAAVAQARPAVDGARRVAPEGESPGQAVLGAIHAPL